MPASIVLRCVGRSVYVMANESFDNLGTRKKENWVSKEFVLGPSIKTYTVLCGHLIVREGCSLVTISVCRAFNERTHPPQSLNLTAGVSTVPHWSQIR